jgi:hypothetical protein
MTNNISKFLSILGGSIIAVLATLEVAFANDISVSHDLKDFDQIRLDNVGIQLEVEVGEDFAIEVSGDEELVETLLLKVRGDKLVIYRDDNHKVWDGRGNDSPLVTVSMPSFTGFELRGAVDASIKGVDSDEVEFDLKGAGNIEVEGRCRWLIVDLKGAGNVEADDLICEEVDVTLKGAGNIEVHASKRVDADIDGLGNIDVYGSPEEVKKDDGWLSHISIH